MCQAADRGDSFDRAWIASRRHVLLEPWKRSEANKPHVTGHTVLKKGSVFVVGIREVPRVVRDSGG